jgi:cytochrome c553
LKLGLLNETVPSTSSAAGSRRSFKRSPKALLAAVGALACQIALAQATAPAKFEDTIAQRVLACTGCHGPQGRAAIDGYYPRIAGKPPVYLYNQLLNFRDGRRRYALMTNLLAPLDDAYLREIAEHFSTLEVAYPPPQPATEAADVIEQGRRLVMQGDPTRGVPACVRCHGETMMGVAPSIPGLLGLPRDYLNAQLGAWRGDNRRAQAPDCMAQVAKALAPADISAVSAWLAAQPASGKPATSLPAPLPLDCGGVSTSAIASAVGAVPGAAVPRKSPTAAASGSRGSSAAAPGTPVR